MILRVELLGFGLLKKSDSGNFNEPSAKSPTGYYIRTDEVQVIADSLDVVCTLGSLFGIKYKLHADCEEPDEFEAKIIHPELYDPRSGKCFSESCESKFNIPAIHNFDFYEFENDWELIPGNWIFQINQVDRKLLEVTFRVSKGV